MIEVLTISEFVLMDLIGAQWEFQNNQRKIQICYAHAESEMLQKKKIFFIVISSADVLVCLLNILAVRQIKFLPEHHTLFHMI